VLADGLQRGAWPMDPTAWPDEPGSASSTAAEEAEGAEVVETMDLRSFGNRYALVAALHHWLAEAATSIGDGGSSGGGGAAELVIDRAVGGGDDTAEPVIDAAAGAVAGAGALRVILSSGRYWNPQRLWWVEEELQGLALPYEVERAVMRDGEEGCALRLQRAQIWPELPRRLARAPPPGGGGGGSGDSAADGRREGGRGRSRDAELVEHIEKLRHGLPDGDGWASLAAAEAGRGRASTWVQRRTPRPDDGLARDGRRRATKSHRRANYY
jgi:hypothetical protein